jgi:flavin-dependent dehydrogenase
LTAPDGAFWETGLPGVALGLGRSALDAALAAQAAARGVQVRPATNVTAVAGDLATGFTVTARTASGQEVSRARAVIAAHGKRGALDRALGRRFLNKPQPFVALKAHFQGPPVPGRVELHTFPGGYCGLSEIEGGLINLCFLARAPVFRSVTSGAPDRPAAFLAWLARQNSGLGSWLSGARRIDERWQAAGEVPFVNKRPVVNDVLMAGDSAGLIAPLAGDGIAMALRGGQVAAEHCAAFLAGQLSAAAMPRAYAGRWRREFGARLRLAQLLQGILLRPIWVPIALRVLNTFPGFGDFLVQHTREVRNAT